ncbi:MAG: GEVED domain-containing protein [Bacteroidota bacterium]
MKKIILFSGIILVFSTINLFSQVNAYSFAQVAGTTSALSTPYTTHTTGTTDYGVYTGIAIGFTFNYNCIDYTTLSISNDGYIVFGNSLSNTYTPLSTGTDNNVVAALAADLQGAGAGSSLRSKVLGSSPNRQFVVEWLNYGDYWNGGDYSFQIVLNETSNVIDIYYVTTTIYNGNTFQVGLRGASSADFNNRTKAAATNWLVSTAGTANSDVMTTGGNAGRSPHDRYSWTPTATNCSGIPSAGTASATPAVVCSGDITSLSLSGHTTDCGISYQWQSATALGGPYTNIPGATTIPYDATVSAVTYYQCVSTCSFGGGTNTSSIVTVTLSPPATCYCIPNPSSVDGSGITNITCGAINNTTGAEPGNYGDYTAQSASFAQGALVTVNITYSTGYTYNTKIWVDWNDDGDFDDAGEEVYTGVSGAANPTTLIATFNVPVTASVGNHRMRIGGCDSATPIPCYTGSYGTYEDYTLTVTPGTSMSYSSCTTTQTNTSTVGVNTTNNEVIGIRIVTSGAVNQLDATSFTFNTNGTTAPASDITNARLWTTGTSGTFATTIQVGSVVAAPNGVFVINGTVTLSEGTNYLWLTYDVPTGATVGNVIDARCTAITVDGTGRTPTVTNPAGNRPIDLVYCASTFTNMTDEWISNVTFNTINNNTGQEGPTSYGDYTGISTTVERGNTYSISVTFVSTYSQDVFVWFDWNKDGDFNDANEEFQIADNVTAPTTNAININIPATATLGSTRMRVMTYEFDDPTPCQTGSYGETEDYTVIITTSTTPMTYVSCTAIHTTTAGVGQGSVNKEIIRMEVVTSGMLSPISATEFRIRTDGTTNNATDIQNAKVWYTGTTSTFSSPVQFGATIVAPPGPGVNMLFNGSVTLSPGTNYFWLTYDIQSGATVGNVVDAIFQRVNVDGSLRVPTDMNPTGNRPITPPLPPNDEACGAIALAVNYGGISYQTGDLSTTTTASAGIPAPGCSSLGPDVWFTAVVPASGRLIVDLDDTGGPTDMGMAWYTSSTNDCNNIDVLIECDDDDSQNGSMPMICRSGAICTVPGDCAQNATLTPGTTIYIRVWEYGGGTFGNFLIGAYDPGDPGAASTCATAETIPSLPFTSSNSTCCRQNNYDSGDGCGSLYQDGEDYLYKYTPPVDEVVDITLSGTSSYTGVFVTDDCPSAGGVNCIGSQTASGGNPMLCGVSLSAGTTYYIMVDTDPNPTCTPFSINVASSSSPTCNMSYTISNIAYNWETYFGTNIVLPIDDRFCDVYIPMAFPLCYDGYQFTNLLVSSNGYLIFDPISCSTNLPTTNAAPNTYSGWSITAAVPNLTNAPRNSIMGPWHDIDPAQGGIISYGVLGTAPNRRFIVTWANAPLFSSSCGQIISQQIKLYEANNNIEIHIMDKECCSAWNGGAAILGLHNYNGTLAIVPAGHNYPTQWTAHDEAWRFTYSCPTCITPLPVNFLSFTGESLSETANLLKWSTSSEQNCDYFEVQRMIKYNEFEVIGYEKGAGNSNLRIDYEFTDNDIEKDVNFYRIKQVDFDGQYKYTNVINISSNNYAPENDIFFPNPAKTDVYFLEKKNVDLYTIDGKFILTDTTEKLDVSFLEPGVYMIRINGVYAKLIKE